MTIAERRYICSDNDSTEWFYYPDEKIYRRFRGELLRGKIMGDQLPDPHMLLNKRREVYPEAELRQIMPSPATFKLWDDWQHNQRKIREEEAAK